MRSSLFLDCLTPDDGTDRLSRNVANQIPIYAASHPRRVKILFTPRPKPEITKWLSPYRVHIVVFAWRDWGTPRRTLVRIADSLIEIQTQASPEYTVLLVVVVFAC